MTKTLVIPPTIGRRVLLFVAGTAGANNHSVPFDAGIAYVWGDDNPVKNTINCGYMDHSGIAQSATSVALYDRPQTTGDRHGSGETYAVWMPFQWEQAVRALEPKAPQAGPGRRPPDVQLTRLDDADAPMMVEGTLPTAGDEQA